ncbi:MAG TPA: T9SS type A sorting domain-containing protein, partial [Ignavibacteriaceae bacterium]|nr:T9SS type A sorting domain-containing protein [Ignavibacteriaceae bacterium]
PAKAQIVTVFDTVYALIGNQARVGTMFIPSEGNGMGVLVVHGSGVTRITNRPWCDSLAANGHTVFTIEYPIGNYPGPAAAIKLALEFLRENAESFGITTGKIAGLGFSYGAATLGQAIIWDNDDTFFQTNPSIDDHFNAVALLYGIYTKGDFSNNSLRQKGLCIQHVSNINTPVLLLHGTGDSFVNYQESVKLQDSLTFYGKHNQLILYNGLQHGFDLNWPAANAFTSIGLQAKDSVLTFFRNNQITGIKEGTDYSLPTEFMIIQNYPNPFNPSTTISYSILTSEFVTLKVFDVLGSEVATLVNEEKPAGSYNVNFNAINLPSGVYLYKFQAGSFIQTRKMILMK